MIPPVYESEALVLRYADVTEPSSLKLTVRRQGRTLHAILDREHLTELADALDGFLRERGLR